MDKYNKEGQFPSCLAAVQLWQAAKGLGVGL